MFKTLQRSSQQQGVAGVMISPAMGAVNLQMTLARANRNEEDAIKNMEQGDIMATIAREKHKEAEAEKKREKEEEEKDNLENQADDEGDEEMHEIAKQFAIKRGRDRWIASFFMNLDHDNEGVIDFWELKKGLEIILDESSSEYKKGKTGLKPGMDWRDWPMILKNPDLSDSEKVLVWMITKWTDRVNEMLKEEAKAEKAAEDCYWLNHVIDQYSSYVKYDIAEVNSFIEIFMGAQAMPRKRVQKIKDSPRDIGAHPAFDVDYHMCVGIDYESFGALMKEFLDVKGKNRFISIFNKGIGKIKGLPGRMRKQSNGDSKKGLVDGVTPDTHGVGPVNEMPPATAAFLEGGVQQQVVPNAPADHEDEYAILQRKFKRRLETFYGKSTAFTWNPILLIATIVLQAGLVPFFVNDLEVALFWGPISSGIAWLLFVALMFKENYLRSVDIYVFRSYKEDHSEELLRWFKIALPVTYIFVAATFFNFRYLTRRTLFDEKTFLAAEWTSGWSVNLLCMMGIAIIAFWQRSATSKLQQKRDYILLEMYEMDNRLTKISSKAKKFNAFKAYSVIREIALVAYNESFDGRIHDPSAYSDHQQSVAITKDIQQHLNEVKKLGASKNNLNASNNFNFNIKKSNQMEEYAENPMYLAVPQQQGGGNFLQPPPSQAALNAEEDTADDVNNEDDSLVSNPLRWRIARYVYQMLLPLAGATILPVCSYYLFPHLSHHDMFPTWFGYFLQVVLLTVPAIAPSIYVFQELLWKVTYRPFYLSLKQLELLNASTDAEKSVRHGLPFIPLDSIDNIRAFLKIHNVIKVYVCGEKLHEAASGFSGLLISDVVVIATLTFAYLQGWNLRALVLLLFWALILTELCLKILLMAVHINQQHEGLLNMLIEQKTACALKAIDYEEKTVEANDDGKKKEGSESTENKKGKDPKACAEVLQDVHQCIKETHSALKILGIPTTPYLWNAFLLYLITNVGALIWKQVGL